jgi:hypothetical protein
MSHVILQSLFGIASRETHFIHCIASFSHFNRTLSDCCRPISPLLPRAWPPPAARSQTPVAQVSRCDGGVCEDGLSNPGRRAGARRSTSGTQFGAAAGREMCARTTSNTALQRSGRGENGGGPEDESPGLHGHTQCTEPLGGEARTHQGRVVRLTRLTRSTLVEVLVPGSVS